jgi:hypothetical protein
VVLLILTNCDNPQNDDELDPLNRDREFRPNGQRLAKDRHSAHLKALAIFAFLMARLFLSEQLFLSYPSVATTILLRVYVDSSWNQQGSILPLAARGDMPDPDKPPHLRSGDSSLVSSSVPVSSPLTAVLVGELSDGQTLQNHQCIPRCWRVPS